MLSTKKNHIRVDLPHSFPCDVVVPLVREVRHMKRFRQTNIRNVAVKKGQCIVQALRSDLQFLRYNIVRRERVKFEQ